MQRKLQDKNFDANTGKVFVNSPKKIARKISTFGAIFLRCFVIKKLQKTSIFYLLFEKKSTEQIEGKRKKFTKTQQIQNFEE